ncbi:hypothetical protein ACHAWF_010414 [Thalassiosira exigua]
MATATATAPSTSSSEPRRRRLPLGRASRPSSVAPRLPRRRRAAALSATMIAALLLPPSSLGVRAACATVRGRRRLAFAFAFASAPSVPPARSSVPILRPAAAFGSGPTSRATRPLHRLAAASSSSRRSLESLELLIPTPEDMRDVGALLSYETIGGDAILLDGDLGAGKTCFARGFVRGRSGWGEGDGDEGLLRVTSPTYLLSNSYPVAFGDEGDDSGDGDGEGKGKGEELKVYHMDLYRLSGAADDLAPLDLENVFARHISLVEWPCRLRERPTERLDVTLTIDASDEGYEMLDGAAGDDIDADEDDGDGDEKNIDADDRRCRRMTLIPHGTRWADRLRFLVDEGYLEDLLIVDDPAALDG